jgi:uncharacterized protein YndB with AHSA1/START domain
VKIERSGVVPASVDSVWRWLADWQSHREWQPTLAGVEAPEEIGEGTRLVEMRASHGQRLTFDVTITEWRPGQRIRASGKSRGVVSIAADLIYQVAGDPGGSMVTIAVEAEIPFVLLPLRHAVQTEAEKELAEMLSRLAALQERDARAS